MGRAFDVKVHGISCERNGFGGEVLIGGSVIGARYLTNPDSPADVDSSEVIYPFPSGPVAVREGQTVPIHMDDSVSFSVYNSPHDSPPSTPRFLKVTGSLNNGLGSQSLTLSKDNSVSLRGDPPTLKAISFSANNLRVSLIISLNMWVG